jgi:hypothetical protein
VQRSVQQRCSLLIWMGIMRWRLRYNNSRQGFVNTKCVVAFVTKMAPQTIRRHAGDRKEQVHLHLHNAESGLPSRLHYVPECLLLQPLPPTDITFLKLSTCRPDIRIHIPFFHVRKFSTMLRTLITIPILIQICWLMTVSTLSGGW